MKKIIKWTIGDIVNIIKQRRSNEFDANMIVSGDRGNGKSTLIAKILYRFKEFKPWQHQVYDGESVIKLLKNQKYGLCWDDEAINSGYKRNWQSKAQQELIKIITAYRDSYNIYASAVPNFFSMDKDLRDLYFLHLHVIARGIAVVHMPLQGRLYSQDRWDTKYNAKVEEKWSKRIQENPNYRPPYHKLSTFRGYLFFTDLTKLQKELYKEIKRTKREESFKSLKKEKEFSFIDNVYKMLCQKRLSQKGLKEACIINEKKYSSTITALRSRLTDDGYTETPKDLFIPEKTKKDFIIEDSKEAIADIMF